MPNIDLTKCWLNAAPPPAAPDAADIEEHGSLIAFQIHVVRFLTEWLPLAPVVSQAKPGAITYADKKTVATDVTKALQSIGLSMVVGLDSGTRNSAMRHAVTFNPFSFVINIAESPITNRGSKGTGITASRCAEHVMLCLSGATLGNGSCDVKAFSTGGEEGILQTAQLTFSTAYAIVPSASLMSE
jgi:hypothetical protein